MKTKSRNVIGWIFSSPYLILGTLFFLIPLFWAFFLSITNWNLMSPKFDIVGIENFAKAIFSPEVQAAFFNAYKFAILIVPLVVVISFVLAYTIYHLPRKVKPVFSVAFFVPYISSGVAISFVVRGLLSYNSPLNELLRANWGITLDINTNAALATGVIVAMIVWKMVGYYSLFLLSSLESIERDVHDAAKIDGVGPVKKIFSIILPMIYPALFTITTLSVGLCFGIFTEPYMLTGGGPDMATNTWQLTVFNESFVRSNSGYGAAVAILNAVVIFISLLAIQKLLKKWGARYGW
ncbi:carbohydrate ABC transporter permease [Culicoidibacter larvae]|uniref:Sugar ABC transporter permease n=1 Tax=Culicoidibacter larvae TaxID=2579976 RepID=A0A5R8QAK6_9FIRM|nr:sugar ABC transporter permease [Culicoidibacter larvae]TLG72933.1 sugar ABC transporter permease [Culicoidibacter larvae]